MPSQILRGQCPQKLYPCYYPYQRCADPKIFESTSVSRFCPRIRCQPASATREKYWICVRLCLHWL